MHLGASNALDCGADCGAAAFPIAAPPCSSAPAQPRLGLGGVRASGETAAREVQWATEPRLGGVAPSTLPQGLSVHNTPFSAIAALLDDCVSRAEHAVAATYASLDVRSERGGLLLVYEHDCNGMSLEELSDNVGLSAGPNGQSRPRSFIQAALRLGSCATVLTKQLEAGRVLPTVGVGVVMFDPGAAGRTVTGVLYCSSDQSLGEAAGTTTPTNYHQAFARCGNVSWDMLQHELDTMPAQGTRVLIRSLWSRAEGGPELDFVSDSTDICCNKDDALSDLLPTERKDLGVQRCMVHRYSLRAYAAILYRCWPEGLVITLRGVPVQPQDIRAWMGMCISEEYRPRGVKDEVDEHGFQMQHVVNVHVGFLIDAPQTSMQGFCLYHRNRLIKPFWRAYSSNTVGRGVVGYLDVDFVSPTPNWQDFERNHAFQKLEAFLKRCVPAYWKKHAAAAGYLAGPAAALASGRSQPQLAGSARGGSGALPWQFVVTTQQQQQQQQQRQVAGSLQSHLLAQQPGAAAGLGRQGSRSLAPVFTRALTAPAAPLQTMDISPTWAQKPWANGHAGRAASTDQLPPAMLAAGQHGSGLGVMLPPSAMCGPSQAPEAREGSQQQQLQQHFHGRRQEQQQQQQREFLRHLSGGRSQGPLPKTPPMTLPPAMHAVLQAMATTSNTIAPPAPLPLGLQNLLQDVPLGQASAAAASASARDSQSPAIQHLQRLLASAPQAVVEQLQQQQQQQQQGAQPTHFQVAANPHEHQRQAQQQQPRGPPLRSGSFGQQQPGSPLECRGTGLSGGSGSGIDLSWLNSQPFSPKAEPAADLAQALAALIAQPHQLAQLVTQFSQQVQRAEQAGQPNSEALRQVYSLLSKMAGPELEGPCQAEGPGMRGNVQRSASAKVPDAAGHPSLIPPVSPPTSAAQAVASARAFLRSLSQSSGQGAAEAGRAGASSPTGKGSGVGSPLRQQEEEQQQQQQRSDRGALHSFSVLLSAAEAGVPSPEVPIMAHAEARAAASPSMAEKSGLGAELESAIVAFVQQAVDSAQQQSAGLELARRVRSAVERLEAERAPELVDPAPPGAKRQRA